MDLKAVIQRLDAILAKRWTDVSNLYYAIKILRADAIKVEDVPVTPKKVVASQVPMPDLTRKPKKSAEKPDKFAHEHHLTEQKTTHTTRRESPEQVHTPSGVRITEPIKDKSNDRRSQTDIS